MTFLVTFSSSVCFTAYSVVVGAPLQEKSDLVWDTLKNNIIMLYPGPNSHGYFQLVMNTYCIWLLLDLVHFKFSSQKQIIVLTLLVTTNNSTTNHSTVPGPISLPTITITTYLSLSLMKCVSLKPELNPENLS